MDQEKIRQVREKQAKAKQAKEEAARQAAQANQTQDAIHTNTVAGARATQAVAQAVNTSSSKISQDIKSSSKEIINTLSEQNSGVQDALNNLVVATVLSRDPQLVDVVKNFTALIDNLATASKKLDNNPLNDLPNVTKELAKALNDFGGKLTEKEEPDYTQAFKDLQSAIQSLPAPVVKVPKPDKIDLSALSEVSSKLDELKKAIANQKFPAPDLEPVLQGLEELNTTFRSIKIPVPNFIQDPFIRYKAADEFDDGVSTNVKYYGFVDPEGKWYIIKNDPSASAKTYRYAFGSQNYATNWTNRASLTYDLPYIGFP